ncbi:hypothetical protein ABZ370_21485 [Streptomyces sp. NPDC005962]|uniref:hypothetical protein n=1 Tax=Streptomyces sp. NPDC005962 TaxID=3154466 RepID=UPI0033EE3A3D
MAMPLSDTRTSSAPIVGTTKPHHLTDAVAATELKLSAEELTRLEEHYTTRPASGFRPARPEQDGHPAGVPGGRRRARPAARPADGVPRR